MKTFVPVLIVLCALFLTIGCKKNHDNNTPPDTPSEPFSDPGTCQITFNKDTAWNATKHWASWSTKWNHLYISLSSYQRVPSAFTAGFVIDPSNPVKRYPLNKNGENTANITFDNSNYYSDIDTADAGGYFDLTKFDTVKKTISGYMEFTGYTVITGKKSFTTVKIDDIPLAYDTMNYNGNAASFTIQEKTKTDVTTNRIYPTMTYCSDGTSRFYSVDFYIYSILKDKFISFSIPLKYGKGTYRVYPDLLQYNGCDASYVTSKYSGRASRTYMVQSGSLNILNIDTALRRLNATFNINYRDTVTGANIIITNGQLDLNYWQKIGEQ